MGILQTHEPVLVYDSLVQLDVCLQYGMQFVQAGGYVLDSDLLQEALQCAVTQEQREYFMLGVVTEQAIEIERLHAKLALKERI